MAVFHTPMITLSDGNLIPQIGLGVLRIDDEGVTPVVESALEAGYRHIDGAAGYNNEAGVGRALQNAGFTQGENRKNLWVTTKLRDSEQGFVMFQKRVTEMRLYVRFSCCSTSLLSSVLPPWPLSM